MSVSVGLNSTICLTRLRAQIGDLDNSGSGRWTDSVLLEFIDAANKRIVRDILFPDSRVEQPTVSGVQLYRFPLMLKTDRVYVGGQLIIPSDIPTLEGQQIGFYDRSQGASPNSLSSSPNDIWDQSTWDQSVFGPVPNPYITSAGPGPYADAPTNTTGVASPSWTDTTPLSYPTTQGQWTTPAPDAEPWYCGSTPRYYWRGGWLGIVPIPTNDMPVTTIAVEGVRQPDTVDNPSQVMTTPENFLDAIVWGAAAYCKFADDGSRAEQQRVVAEQNYEREKRKLIEWRGLYPGEQRNGPKVNTLRPAYAGYHMKRNRGWG